MSRVGLEGVTNINTGTFGTPSWLAFDSIKDLTLGMTAGMADMSSRASGWRTFLPHLKEMSPEFNVVYDSTDTAQALVQGSFLAGTSIDLQILDSSGGSGFRAQFYVSEFGKGEPLEEGQTISVKLVLALGSTPTVV